jgi:hypothetical protein
VRYKYDGEIQDAPFKVTQETINHLNLTGNGYYDGRKFYQIKSPVGLTFYDVNNDMVFKCDSIEPGILYERYNAPNCFDKCGAIDRYGIALDDYLLAFKTPLTTVFTDWDDIKEYEDEMTSLFDEKFANH